MATLFKQPGSDNWWIRYSKDGKQHRKSTRTADQDKALLQIREIEVLLGHREQGTASQALVKALQTEAVHPVNVAALFAERCKHIADKTRTTYESRDKHFLGWLAQKYPSVSMVSDVNRMMIREFLKDIGDKFLARTHNGYLRRLRSVFNSAVRDGYAIENPTTGVDFLSEDTSSRRAFTEEEIRKLFCVLTGELRLLTTFGLYAGAMRLGDIVSLTWSNIDLVNNRIRWRMSKRKGKHMEITIHSRLMKELLRVGKGISDDPVLPAFYRNVDKASKHFSQALIDAGLKEDRRQAINRRYEQRRKEKRLAEQEGRTFVVEPVRRCKQALDFHSLRYNFVSILKTRGCPEAIARSIMGHASVEVSAIYTQIDDASETKWISSLPDLIAKKMPR